MSKTKAHQPKQADDGIDYPYPLAVARFPTLRQSLLSSFDNCGLTTAFDAEYRKGGNTVPQARGTMFHRVAAACLRQMAEMRESMIPADAALGILRDLLRQDEVDRVCTVCGTDQIEPGIWENHSRRCANGHSFESEFVNLPIASVKDLHWVTVKWANDNSFDIENLVEVEFRLKATLHYPHRELGGMVPRELNGTLDALFIQGEYAEHAIVLDWKDMWSMPAKHADGEDDDLDFGGYFQQRFYAWLIFKSFPSVQTVTLREFYVRYSQPREAKVSREAMPEIEAELEALVERFDRAWNDYLSLSSRRRAAMIRNGKFPFAATPGKHCGFCMRPNACPIPDFAREDGRVLSEADAQKLARRLLVGEKVVKDARSALRAYAAVHGPIPVKDAKGKRAYGYVEVERVTKPTAEQIAQAQLEKGRPLTLVEIRQLYVVKKGTTFKAHVPEDVDESQLEAEIQEQLEKSIEASRARLEEPATVGSPPAEHGSHDDWGPTPF